MLRIALYQPDIPQNVGAMIRLAACLGTALDVIEPCGFPWDEARIRRVSMDYIHNVNLRRHASWDDFHAASKGKRLILMTTRAPQAYTDFRFACGDILLAGRESAGVPEDIHRAVDARITIPLRQGARSLNIVTATAMILGEALRQTGHTSSPPP